MAHRVIFRESAIQAYRRGTAKDIVPRLTFRPIVVCLWLLLAVLIATAALAWSVRVPAYVSAQGTILPNGARAGPGGETTDAALFLPADQSADVRAGQQVQAQIGSTGPSASGAVVRVEPGVIGPDAARAKYRFEPGAGTVRQPWTVVIVRLGQPLPPDAYGGSLLTARVEAGSQRILTFFPGLGSSVGGAS
ncbi:hypothetical protein [Streptomyces sporangiiformans]|uniref:Uncharacterized protein n=1 Tax=Streptomyces sporangiiformans TaxID=2315329 RepID=A0A505D763_9ACTN|nr:hypothetical protein [Streptomyces sporangiiformans]TPQ19524.1 hypothetical protein FGD71_025785 [Streptomyces sporangiiformans]